MPVNLIKEAVTAHLKTLDFKRVNFALRPDVNDTFKVSLLEGSHMNVTLLSESEFEVQIAENQYYQLLAADFWFSHQKVEEHKASFLGEQSQKLPIAWLIVSCYYSAFYSATALSRLFGHYNLYLKQSHCSDIMNSASSAIQLKRGNYIGQVSADTSDYITIRFSAKKKSQPHDLAWQNLFQILNFHKETDIRKTKVQTFKLLKEILNPRESLILTPNNVRNDWNYSFANAYDEPFCREVNDVKVFLSETGRKSVLNWPTSYKKYTSKQNNAYSIVYLEAILRQVVSDMSVKLYESE